MRVINHNWSATKQRPHPQSVAEISCRYAVECFHNRYLVTLEKLLFM